MDSAFGIDHGEISKGRLTWGKPPRLTTRAQRRTAGKPGAQSGPEQLKGALHRVGEAPLSLKGIGSGAGKSVKNTGRFLEANPGITGAALVGGSGAGGYKYLSGKEPKRKRTS